MTSAGALVEELELAGAFGDLVDADNITFEVELSRTFTYELDKHPNFLSEELRSLPERGRSMSLDRYMAAQRTAAECGWQSDRLFEKYEVLLAPSTRSEAPIGRSSTGDPISCRTWTLLGMPCLSLPGLYGSSGLPVGAQFIGPLYRDGLAPGGARWAASRVLAVGAPSFDDRIGTGPPSRIPKH
jgi:Asp-tRNA(Asn)/Glu-tRNA(Gln) amidotransferase A subunit family amidase